MATTINDPRPDLATDSPLWTRLLALTTAGPPGYTPYSTLTEPLLTMRQNGTVLKRLNGQEASYALRPIVNAEKSCWPSLEAYKEKAAELIKPHHNQFIELLQVFTYRVEAELSQSDEKARINAHLDIKGYCALKSEALGGEVVWFVRDRAAGKNVAEFAGNAATYTLDELQALVDKPPGDEALRKLHNTKKLFNGTIGTISGEVAPA